jgi:hypothetical protein
MEGTRCISGRQESESTDMKPWETPAVEELDIDQTESDFIAVTDGTSFFS